MKPLVTSTGMLIRREIWEHKTALVWTPVIVAVVLVVFLLLTSIYAGINHSSDLTSLLDAGASAAETPEGEDTLVLDFSAGRVVISDEKHLQALSWSSRPENVMTTVFHELAFGFTFLSSIVAIFYLLSALFADRRDRSILFWKSLPFSEGQGITAKLIVATLVLPLVALLASVVVQVVAAAIMTTVYTMTEHYSLVDVLKQIGIVKVFFIHLGLLLVFAIKSLPLFSWLMFCSAAARRSPLGLAVIPPLVIIAVEYFIFQTTVVAEFLGSVFFAFPVRDDEFSWSAVGGQALIDQFLTLSPMHLLNIVLVTVPLLYGALWFRNRDYEM